jgi:DNA polymerase I-like protein with 3'-5' exonuclease and polymerase domains
VKREHLVWGTRGLVLRGERFDPTIASYLLDPGRHAHTLADIARAELNAELISLESVLGKGKGKVAIEDLTGVELVDYAGQRADFQLRLANLLSAAHDAGRLPAAHVRHRAAARARAGRHGARGHTS